MTGTFPAYGMSPSLSTITSTSSSITSSIPDTERECPTLTPEPSRQGQLGGTAEGPPGASCLSVRGGWRGGDSVHSSYLTLQFSSVDAEPHQTEFASEPVLSTQ